MKIISLINICFGVILLAASLLFFSCSKDDDPQPDSDNIPLEVGGTMSAYVDGERVTYMDIRVVVYGLSNTVGIMGHQQIDELRKDRVRVGIPLEPTRGTFNHNDPMFFINYEAITGNSEDGAGFNREAEGKITVSEYRSIGKLAGETYYYVKGAFDRSGMNNFNSERVDLQDGVFEFVYKY